MFTPNAELDAAAPKPVPAGLAPNPIEPAGAPKALLPPKAGEDCAAPNAELDAGAPKALPPSVPPPKAGVEGGTPNAPALAPKEGADAAPPKAGADAAPPNAEPILAPKTFVEVAAAAPPNAGAVGEVPNGEPPGPGVAEPNAGAGALPNVDAPGDAPNAFPEGVLLAPNIPPPPNVARAHLVRGDAFRLPFAGGAFEAVVACRFLHHLHGEDDLLRAVAELVRVSSRLVVASFWDAASLPAWRRRLGLAKDEGPSGRRAHPKRAIRAAFEAAGARVVGFRHSFRFVSQQTFAAAVVREPAGGDPG